MSSSVATHVAVFTVGALFGVGLSASLSSTRPLKRPTIESTGANSNVANAPLAVSVGSPISKTDDDGRGNVLRYGNPGPVSDLLARQAYVAAYDRRLRHPAWTAEHLTANTLAKLPSGGGDRSKSDFREDESLPPTFRATLKDYFRSGYDRGHMVPAADAKRTQDAMNETFLLSNIAPQIGPGFNRHYWAYVEDWCRRLTSSFKDVYVFTVPLYLPALGSDGKHRVTYEVIGSPPNVSVPTHFAKVVLATRPISPAQPTHMEVSTGAFVLPNAPISDEEPFRKFAVPVEAVERAAGLSIFSEDIKQQSKHICQSTSCEIIVRRFDDAMQNSTGRRNLASPKETAETFYKSHTRKD